MSLPAGGVQVTRASVREPGNSATVTSVGAARGCLVSGEEGGEGHLCEGVVGGGSVTYMHTSVVTWLG